MLLHSQQWESKNSLYHFPNGSLAIKISHVCSKIHSELNTAEATEASVVLGSHCCSHQLDLVPVNVVDRVLESAKATTYNLNPHPSWLVKPFKGTLDPLIQRIMNVSLIGDFPKPLKKTDIRAFLMVSLNKQVLAIDKPVPDFGKCYWMGSSRATLEIHQWDIFSWSFSVWLQGWALDRNSFSGSCG